MGCDLRHLSHHSLTLGAFSETSVTSGSVWYHRQVCSCGSPQQRAAWGFGPKATAAHLQVRPRLEVHDGRRGRRAQEAQVPAPCKPACLMWVLHIIMVSSNHRRHPYHLAFSGFKVLGFNVLG